MRLKWNSPDPKDREKIEKYMRTYGENSCQHSYVSMVAHADKYGDVWCEEDGFLLVCRSRLEDDYYRFYLCPVGDPSDKKGFVTAVKKLCEDAASVGKRVCFHTVTEAKKELFRQRLPGQFLFEEKRDLFEYLCKTENIANLAGKDYARRRNEVNVFKKRYEGRIRIDEITPADFEEMMSLTLRWREAFRRDGEEMDTNLLDEAMATKRVIDRYEQLKLTGITVRLDGRLIAYTFGAPLSDTAMDGIIEKADRNHPHIYAFLNNAFAKICCSGYEWMNWEEDLGEEGLRTMKLGYHPDLLMKKYEGRERAI